MGRSSTAAGALDQAQDQPLPLTLDGSFTVVIVAGAFCA
jgi:hypothetical protein